MAQAIEYWPLALPAPEPEPEPEEDPVPEPQETVRRDPSFYSDHVVFQVRVHLPTAVSPLLLT